MTSYLISIDKYYTFKIKWEQYIQKENLVTKIKNRFTKNNFRGAKNRMMLDLIKVLSRIIAYLISCRWSLSIPPESIRKPEVF